MQTGWLSVMLFDYTSGEGGNITPAFSQLPIGTGLLTQVQKQQRLRYFLLFAVATACLTQFRLSSSSVSAQSSSGGKSVDGGGVGSLDEPAAAYARFSSKNQDEDSIDQQFTKIHEAAHRNGHYIPPELHFKDEAVSGRKRHRRGLNELLEKARQGLFKKIYLWDVSRLARETAISLPLIKEIVHVHGIQLYCVSNRMDSSQPGFENYIHFQCMMAQEQLTRLAVDVRRGHSNNFRDNYSNGDVCFGYRTEIAPGYENANRARKIRPKKISVIDQSQAEWVLRIFRWYVIELRSMFWIAKELNRLKAPRDHRASSKNGWTATGIGNLLDNRKYIGIWPYGKRKNKCNPLTGEVTVVIRSEDDPDYQTSERPELRIIDDELFYKAQQRREEIRKKYTAMRGDRGKLKGSSRDLNNPRHLLQGLMHCAKCNRSMNMNGLRGLYLQCSGYPSRLCDVKTSLFRAYAEKQILDVLRDKILSNVGLQTRLFNEVKSAWDRMQVDLPQERKALEKSRSDVEKKVKGLLDGIEKGESGPEVSARLGERRRELAGIQRQLDSLAVEQTLSLAPTQEWIMEKLKDLHQILSAAPSLAGLALRKLIGSVSVMEVECPGLKRRKLVGTFMLSGHRVASSAFGVSLPETDVQEEITVCFAPLPIWAARADEVKALYDQNLSAVKIAEKLGLKFGAIAKALSWWYVQRGLPVPSGSEKRSRIIKPTPIQDAVKAEVIRLWMAGVPIHAIAKQVGCSRNSVTVVIKRWHEEQGKPWLNGQARRKQLRLQRESESDQDAA